MRHILLSVFCITGCDTYTFFFGIGKKKAFQVMCKHAQNHADLAKLGTSLDLSSAARAADVQFVSLLYDQHKCTSLNSLKKVFALRNPTLIQANCHRLMTALFCICFVAFTSCSYGDILCFYVFSG